MTWLRIRSRRHPAFWAPVLVCVLVFVPLAVWTHVWAAESIRALHESAASDPEAAMAEAIRLLRRSAWVLSSLTAALGASLVRYFQLGLREGRLPPSGWWSLGAWRAATGPTARRMSRLGLAAAVVVTIAALGFGLAVEYVLWLLLQGRLSV